MNVKKLFSNNGVSKAVPSLRRKDFPLVLEA